MRESMIAMALMAGALLPVQAVVNGQLRAIVGSPILTSFFSFMTGSVVLATVYALTNPRLPTVGLLSSSKAWMWLGGPLGTFYVLTAIVATPKLGATAMIAMVIAGQLGMAMVLDHYALLGLAERPVTLARLAGVALLAAGAYLVVRH